MLARETDYNVNRVAILECIKDLSKAKSAGASLDTKLDFPSSKALTRAKVVPVAMFCC